MTIDEILAELHRTDGVLAEKALREAIEQQEAITPHLIKILEETRANAEELAEKEGYFIHLYALMLLAQFREKQAIPAIIDLLKIPDDLHWSIFGDFITEDLPRVLGCVSHGETDHLMALIQDESVNMWVRGSAVEAFPVMVNLGEISMDSVQEHFYTLCHGGLDKITPEVWMSLGMCIAQLHLTELRPEVEQMFVDDLIEPIVYGQEDIDELFDDEKESVLREEVYESNHYQPVDDVVEEMSSWLFFDDNDSLAESSGSAQSSSSQSGGSDQGTFEREVEKVGRNDPCPCGSGRKYKKCHGRPG